jgi:Na+-transporting methylmalonyl-CoA/oxaloacetate decarboxylase gamma subunit
MEPVVEVVNSVENIISPMYIVPKDLLVAGFAVLFAMLLVVLIAVLRQGGSRRAKDAAPQPALAPALAASAPAYQGVDPQVVAAIAAAVAVMGRGEGKRLVVRSVRRTGYGWADSGRRDSLY